MEMNFQYSSINKLFLSVGLHTILLYLVVFSASTEMSLYLFECVYVKVSCDLKGRNNYLYLFF